MRAELYRGLDSSCEIPPDASSVRKKIKSARKQWDYVFNKQFGSLFRSGSKQSFFSMQVLRYADLYASDYLNLLHYPLFYLFSARASTAPHESQFAGDASDAI